MAIKKSGRRNNDFLGGASLPSAIPPLEGTTTPILNAPITTSASAPNATPGDPATNATSGPPAGVPPAPATGGPATSIEVPATSNLILNPGITTAPAVKGKDEAGEGEAGEGEAGEGEAGEGEAGEGKAGEGKAGEGEVLKSTSANENIAEDNDDTDNSNRKIRELYKRAEPFINDFVHNAKKMLDEVMHTRSVDVGIKNKLYDLFDTTAKRIITLQLFHDKEPTDKSYLVDDISEEIDAKVDAENKKEPKKSIDYYMNLYNVNKIKKRALDTLERLIDIEQSIAIDHIPMPENKLEGLANEVIRISNRAEAANRLAIEKTDYDNGTIENIYDAIKHAYNNLVFFDMVTKYKIVPAKTGLDPNTLKIVDNALITAIQDMAKRCQALMSEIADNNIEENNRILLRQLAKHLIILVTLINQK